MSPNQNAKFITRINNDRTLRPWGPGNGQRMLAAAVRAENGSNLLTNAQYTTITNPYKRRSP